MADANYLFERAGATPPPTTADLYEAMANQALLERLPLTDLLRSCAEAGIELSPKRLADYSLIPVHTATSREMSPLGPGYADGYYAPAVTSPVDYVGQQREDGRYYKIFLNGPIGVMLKYRKSPQAVVSFSVEDFDRQRTLQLSQIQSVNSSTKPIPATPKDVRHPRGLMPLHYPELMIRMAEQIANAVGLSSVTIKDSFQVLSDGKSNAGISPWIALRNYEDAPLSLGYSHLTSYEHRLWQKTL